MNLSQGVAAASADYRRRRGGRAGRRQADGAVESVDHRLLWVGSHRPGAPGSEVLLQDREILRVGETVEVEIVPA